MDTSTTANLNNESDPSFTGSCEKVTGLKASDTTTVAATANNPKTVPHGNADDNPDYLRPWELVPVFTAMALAIFILGLASSISPFLLITHLLIFDLQDNTIVGTATPTITNEFHSLTDFGWYGSACKSPCATGATRPSSLHPELTPTSSRPSLDMFKPISFQQDIRAMAGEMGSYHRGSHS